MDEETSGPIRYDHIIRWSECIRPNINAPIIIYLTKTQVQEINDLGVVNILCYFVKKRMLCLYYFIDYMLWDALY